MLLRKKHLTRASYLEAKSRETYIDKVQNLLPQIAQNWCLCKYVQLHIQDDLLKTETHWLGELAVHMDTINQYSVKKNKMEYTKSAFLEDEYNKPERVYRACAVKFRKENSDGLCMSTQHQKEVCILFANEIESLATCLASKTSILTYLKNTFPEAFVDDWCDDVEF